MPDATPARPAVLLLAGDVRDAWSAALATSGFDVRTTGWLDGITAARLQRPDLVLVSADLPDGAPRTVCAAFRSAGDLNRIPIVVAGAGADRLDAETIHPARADRYVPAGPADALAREVREVLRAGRWEMPLKVRLALLGLTVVGLAAIVAQAALNAHDVELARGLGWRDVVPLAVFATAFAAALAIGLAARPRPGSPLERRRLLGSVALWVWMAGVFVPRGFPLAKLATFSAAFTGWAAWAWLGPRVEVRTPAAASWFQLLAGLLALLAAAPWLAVAWMFAS